MIKNQRQEEILEILKKEQFVEVCELSRRLYASQPTIRRDLAFLEHAGHLHRCHGGAVPANRKNRIPVSFRSSAHVDEKLRLCRTAAALLHAEDVLFADASTTVLHLLDFFKEAERITAVTNGLLTAKQFAACGAHVYTAGGRLLPDSLAAVGACAADCIKQYHADIFFFSAASLSKDGVISDYSEEENALRRCMAQQARTRVFMCDAAKFDKVSAFRLCSLSEVHYIVTTTALPDTLAASAAFKLETETPAFLYRVCRTV